MVAAGIIGAGVLGAGATIYSASQAANAQESATKQASKTEQNMYNQNAAELNPYISGGTGAYGQLNNLLGIGGNGKSIQNTLNNLPGYQFTLQQGLKSTQNAAAARGLGVSGAALKGAANYATGLANSTYGTYANQLLGSAGIGESAASSLAGVGTNTAANIASNQIGAGNAAAAGYNAIGGATNSALGNISSYYLLNSLLGPSSGIGGAGTAGSAGALIG